MQHQYMAEHYFNLLEKQLWIAAGLWAHLWTLLTHCTCHEHLFIIWLAVTVLTVFNKTQSWSFKCFCISVLFLCIYTMSYFLYVRVAVPGLQSSKGYLGERIRVWEGQRGLSFLQNIELRGGELLVPRAGLYYIYAQTYFKLPSMGEMDGETREEQGAQLVQYIYKKVKAFLLIKG